MVAANFACFYPNIYHLERIQWYATRLVTDFIHPVYEERLFFNFVNATFLTSLVERLTEEISMLKAMFASQFKKLRQIQMSQSASTYVFYLPSPGPSYHANQISIFSLFHVKVGFLSLILPWQQRLELCWCVANDLFWICMSFQGWLAWR